MCIKVTQTFLKGTREHLTIEYITASPEINEGNSSYTKNFKFKNGCFKKNLVRSTCLVLDPG